jgi:hypothetical protein
VLGKPYVAAGELVAEPADQNREQRVDLAERRELDPARAAGAVEEAASTAPFDLAMPLPPGVDPTAYVPAGATWCLTELEPEASTLDRVRGVLRDGPTIPAPAGVVPS